jgi:tetratricopeptide (TPR) repeat protein
MSDALMSAGHFDEALRTAEQGISIACAVGYVHNAIAGLGQTAQILTEQGHYQKADARYDQVLEAARLLGDQALERTTLLQQGALADAMEQYNRAVELYKQALRLFQATNDDKGIMQICNQLGNVEVHAGRLSEAKAWYERSYEIAQRLGDTVQLDGITHNFGLVCHLQGEVALQLGDEATAWQRLAEAEHFLQESLQMQIDRQDKPRAAMSWSQLSRVYLLMGDLDKAEAHAHQAREIKESLGLILQLSDVYYDLAQIARARGDEAQAAQWEARRDEVAAELARRARGGDAAEADL